MIMDVQVGVSREGLSAAKLMNFAIPIPPLSEQQRIVARIEQLLPHVADYDIAEQKLTALNDGFPDMLKKSILQSAVQGKLVPQDPADEPASVLLERIRAEKEARIKAGKIKKSKHESVIFRRDNSHYERLDGIERCIDDEIPFEVPENWTWARLGGIGTFIRGSGIKRSDVQSDGVPCVRYGEIYTTYNISFNTAVSFTSEKIADKAKGIMHGDILMTLTGENKEEIGKAVAFIGDEEIVIGGDLATFTGHQQNPLYLSYLLNSPYAIQQKSLLGTGDIIVHISSGKLASILVPLPPLAEQYRIVDQIEELTKKTIEL
jgi:type I restriction enzyme S subunit